MRRVVAIGICSGVMALIAATAGAQAPAAGRGGAQTPAGRGGAPQAPQNLKVLPSTWTLAQVRNLMQTFNTSLGVQCTYCHSADPNAPAPPAGGRGPATDYTLDLKEEKAIARKMISMVMALNADALKGLGDPGTPEKVSCYTCHAGQTFPAVAPKDGWGRGGFSLLPAGPVVAPPGAGPGAAAPGGAPAGGARGN